MNRRIVLRAEAQTDLLAARDWYGQQQAGLGDEFSDAVEDQPEMYAEAIPGVRRAKTRRFPYVVYYRVFSDRLEVIAVIHGSRKPADLAESRP